MPVIWANSEEMNMRKVVMTTVKAGGLITEMNVQRLKREKATPVECYSLDYGAKYSAVFFIAV